MTKPESPIDRRDFLKAAGLAVSSTFFAPAIAGAQDKAGSRPPIVGEGEHRFECHHGWGEVPDHIHWFETHGFAVDKSGLVYVTHRAGPDRPASPEDAQDTVVVFDPDGKFVRSFGKAYHGGGHGIDIREEDGQEFLYLAFMFPINLVVKTDLKGEVVWTKEAPGESHKYDSPDTPFSPTNVAFAPDGGFYVADGYGSNYVHQYDKDAKYLRTWGGTGEAPGQFRTPHGILFDDRPGRTPEVVVADRANARLQYFTAEGESPEVVEGVSFPAHFDTRGDLLLVPDLHARVSIFDAENRVLTHLGYDPEWTETVLDGFKVRVEPDRWEPGRFVHPHDACYDRDGNIYVAEWVVPGRLSFLKKLS